MSHLIVLEGLDGAGTTTQAARLHGYLTSRGVRSLLTRQPSGHPIGQLLREFLVGRHALPDQAIAPETLALLFAADRTDHLQREVEPALAQGRVVVSDRWYHSSLAYQGSAIPLDPRAFDWILQLNRRGPHSARPRAPDLTIFLQVDPLVAARRRLEAGRSAELFDDLATQRLVDAGYLRTIDLLRSAGEHIQVVDGEASLDVVTIEVQRRVSDYLYIHSRGGGQ